MNATVDRCNRFRFGFRGWRRTRPFWAGLFGLAAALVILRPVSTIDLGTLSLTLQTIGGMSAVLIAVVLVCCAIGMWARPEFRLACGVVTIVVALVSLPNANLGGFGVGMLCGLVSGALAIAWRPGRTSATG